MSDISTDGRLLQAGGIGRVKEAFRLGCLVEIFGDHSSLEHSNEVWNFGFPQYIWNKLAAIDEVKQGGSALNNDGSTDQEVWTHRRHAKRLYEVAKYVTEAPFYTAITRAPAVYRGNPFQVEVGMAYGDGLPAEELIDILRFANRVPLQYQQSACAVTKAALSLDWRSYGLSQSKGALPAAPMVLFVHIASVWVPFTSESKEAIAAFPEIMRELRLALQDCGRKLAAHIRAHRRAVDEEKKKSYIELYIPHIGIALREILGFSEKTESEIVATLKDVLERSRSREMIRE